jgi:diguanylate cyclase (GGDEF)-like protein
MMVEDEVPLVVIASSWSGSLGTPCRLGIPASSGTQGTILVLRPATLLPAVSKGLDAAGFAVRFAATEEEAQAILDDRIPAAALIGLSRGADPYERVRWLRSQERLDFVQVIVLAGRVGQAQVGEGLAVGADDVLDDATASEEIVIRILARIARSESMARLALLDPLTGLHNRRFMNDRLRAEVVRSGRSGTLLALVILDLDDFKRINDTLGHAAGDRALASFAQELRTSLREYDLTCRFGGDEFVLVLPDCGAQRAHARLAQFRSERARNREGTPPVTFSAGIAECPRDGVSWAELFEVADRAIRRAKEGGRNRTIDGSTVACVGSPTPADSVLQGGYPLTRGAPSGTIKRSSHHR